MFPFAKMAQPATSIPLSSLGIFRGFLERMVPALRRRPIAGGALEHLATLPLNAHSSLVLVRLGEETLLLGATTQNISLLAKHRDDSPAARARQDERSERRESLPG
jgi:flagellar biogenesis protein FliO